MRVTLAIGLFAVVSVPLLAGCSTARPVEFIPNYLSYTRSFGLTGKEEILTDGYTITVGWNPREWIQK